MRQKLIGFYTKFAESGMYHSFNKNRTAEFHKQMKDLDLKLTSANRHSIRKYKNGNRA